MKQCLYLSITLLFIGIFILEDSAAQIENYQSTVITDPSISRRCEELMRKRNQKIELRQKLTALIVRNKKATQNAPSNKKQALQLLSKNLRRLENEMRLAQLKIQFHEENLVRRGCPGIKL